MLGYNHWSHIDSSVYVISNDDNKLIRPKFLIAP